MDPANSEFQITLTLVFEDSECELLNLPLFVDTFQLMNHNLHGASLVHVYVFY